MNHVNKQFSKWRYRLQAVFRIHILRVRTQAFFWIGSGSQLCWKRIQFGPINRPKVFMTTIWKLMLKKSVLGIMLIRIRLSILMPIPDPDPDHTSSFTLARNHDFLLLSFTVLPVNIFFFLVSIIGFIIFHNLDSTGRSEILWKKWSTGRALHLVKMDMDPQCYKKTPNISS